MELKKIEELIKMIEDTDISEISIEDKAEEVNINIKRGQDLPPVGQVQHNIPQNRPVVDNTSEPVQKTEESKNVSSKEEQLVEGDEIAAPMVGTFYRAPSPEADPFVEIGDRVNSGDTLCIIEAMKLMNEIEAEKSGKIVDIVVEDGEPVEYGQTMFVIKSD